MDSGNGSDTGTEEGFSIWLMPYGDVRNHLAELISRLAVGSKTPVFEPHVTLLGSLIAPMSEVLSQTSELAKSIHPGVLKLTTVDFLDQFFRSVFIRVEKTQYIMDANSRARVIFNRLHDSDYLPHLSLVYGKIPMEEKKAMIAEEIGSDFNIVFEVRSLHLFSTYGEPKDWHRVEEFLLE
jgi:2'-5' RNA ligase